jgi:hypothetical protein
MDAADPGWRRLGALLVEAGLVSEHDLVEALAEQERSGQRLGEVLVARGLVSAAAIANALAEQRGSFLKTEYGFGTGLRALMGRSNVPDSGTTPPEVPPLSPTQPSPDLGHLLFVPTYRGYLLLQRSGSAPALGEVLELPDIPGVRLVVAKLGLSPLPQDKRVCAYLNNL